MKRLRGIWLAADVRVGCDAIGIGADTGPRRCDHLAAAPFTVVRRNSRIALLQLAGLATPESNTTKSCFSENASRGRIAGAGFLTTR